MVRRGYFENQSGNFRLRIVEPGYDADDPNVPANKVVIDSDAIGTLSVWKTGVYIATSQNMVNGDWIVQGWGLPYIPLCTFSFNGQPIHVTGSTLDILRVTSDGIYIQLEEIFDRRFPIKIQWTAYRLPVML